MKLSNIFIAAIAAVAFAGCYNDFEMPAKPVEYSEEMLQMQGFELISIADLKAKFGNISGTGSTNLSDGAAKTMYKHIVSDMSQCSQYELDNNRYIVGNYFIKGKVISNDEQGNVYKSLYIYDGTAAIELKLTNSLYIDYPCEVKDGGNTVWVYVKLPGLYLGNFRMMLSLGDIPTESLNSVGAGKIYPNSNIVSPIKVRKHVLLGKPDKLTFGRLDNSGSNLNAYDVLEIDKNNYSVLRDPKFFGRMMKFNDVKVMFKGVTDQNGVEQPLIDDGIYPSWICTSGTMQGSGYYGEPYVAKEWGKLAYSIDNVALYGQLLVGYNEDAVRESQEGVYVVRTSGYSRYANEYVPANGAVGSVLAIYSIYSKESDYKGGERDYATYQLTPCRFDDILPEYYGDQSETAKALRAKMETWAQPKSDGGSIDDESWELPQTMNDDDSDLE